MVQKKELKQRNKALASKLEKESTFYKVSLYIFYAIISIITLGGVVFSAMLVGNFQPQFVKNMVQKELRHIIAKDITIKNKGTKFEIKLSDCTHYNIHIPEIEIEASIWNLFKRGRTNISKIEIKMDTLNIAKNGAQFLILPNTKSEIKTEPITFLTLTQNYANYHIEKIKVSANHINFQNQEKILKFHDVNLKYDGIIDIKAKMMIDSITSQIQCNLATKHKKSTFKLDFKKMPFVALKSILNLNNQLEFINNSLADCKIKGSIDSSNKLNSKFEMTLHDSFITLFENKLFYNTMNINGNYDSGILNINKISLKNKLSNFKAKNVKISDEGIFFDSEIKFKNINHDIINNLIEKLHLANECTNYLKIKKAELYVKGLLSNKLNSIPKIQSGEITFNNSRILLNKDFILDKLIGKIKINTPDEYSVSAKSGTLNQINNLNKINIKKKGEKLFVQVSGTFEPSCIMLSLSKKDLFNLFDINKLNGFWNGKIEFNIPLKTRLTEEITFNGDGKFTYQDPSKNFDFIQDINCKVESENSAIYASGDITDINKSILTFKYEKKNDQKPILKVRGSTNPFYLNQLARCDIFNQNVDIIDSLITRSTDKISSKFVLNIKNSSIAVPIMDLKSAGENGLLNIECDETPSQRRISFSMNAKNSETSGSVNIKNQKMQSFNIDVNGKNTYNLKGVLEDEIWKIDLAGDTVFLNDLDILKNDMNFDLAMDINKCTSEVLAKTPSRISGFWKKRGKFVKGADLTIYPENSGKIRIKATSNDRISEIQITSPNVNKILNLIGISNNNIIGETYITLIQNRSSDIIKGDILVKNCIVKNNSTVQNLLTLLNITHTNNVIGFSKLFGDLVWNPDKKTISLKNIESKGPLLQMISNGILNLNEKTIHLKGKIKTNTSKETSNYTLEGQIEYPVLDLF